MTRETAAQNAWIMIPARGGSRGVPRKNMRPLAGVPLVARSVRTALAADVAPGRTIVMTDDDEIAAIAEAEGARVVREPTTTGKATLDQVAAALGAQLLAEGASAEACFLTLQPTCPFLTAECVREALARLAEGAGSVLTVVDDRKLRWRIGADGTPRPDYEARLNRQDLKPLLRETGAVIGARLGPAVAQGTRIIEPIALIETRYEEALDIDDFADWAVAEARARRKRVLIRADAAPRLGMGHAYRALALAQEMAAHAVTIVSDASMSLGGAFFERFPVDHHALARAEDFIAYAQAEAPALVILDQLDTTAEQVRALKATGAKIVTFEDLGPGALEADLVVSDLYHNPEVPAERQLAGVQAAILAPSFETVAPPPRFNPTVETLLVVFGGSDPARLTERALESLQAAAFKGEVLAVLGFGARERSIALRDFDLAGELLVDVAYMPALMRRADLALSSAGRTITELMWCGAPTICLCQNEKELSHTHATQNNGVVNLGLGALVDVATLANHVRWLCETPEFRRLMQERARRAVAGRSNAGILERIATRVGVGPLA